MKENKIRTHTNTHTHSYTFFPSERKAIPYAESEATQKAEVHRYKGTLTRKANWVRQPTEVRETAREKRHTHIQIDRKT